MVYASSYVVNVFFTRTLSNTIESFLFVALLHLVVSTVELKSCQKRHVQRKVDQDRNEPSPPGDNKSVSSVSSLKTGFLIGFIIVFGFFNRPTFLIFAFVPSIVLFTDKFHYLQNFSRISFTSITIRILNYLTGVIFGFIFIVTADSIYYGSLSLDAISVSEFSQDIHLSGILEKLTITPWNFIKYNMESQNLSQHGIHPRFTHFLVNSLLMFGHMAFYAVCQTILCIFGLTMGNEKPANSKVWMFLSYFFPLIMLSFFPHQEPRFLLPLIFPLVFTVSEFILGPQSQYSIKVNWVIFNVLGCIVFGILHQGGVVPCLSYLQKLTSESRTGTNHIVFYHTYMPPKHLLQIPKTANNISNDALNLLTHDSVTLHDLQGSSVKVLTSHIQTIIDDHKNDLSELSILVASPSSLDWVFCDVRPNYQFKLRTSFGGHLTLEDPPDLKSSVWCEGEGTCNMPCKDNTLIHSIYQLFSLNLYKVVISK